MIKIIQTWNIDGPNHYGSQFIRIHYKGIDLSDETIQRVFNQIGITSGAGMEGIIAEISKKLLGIDSTITPESSNDQSFMLYSGVNEGRALSTFNNSIYILYRLLNNPDTTLEHVIKEVESPIHSSLKPFVIGVTGTNGKTTVVNLIYKMLRNCVNPRLKVGKIDSLNVEIDLESIGGITDEQYDSSRYLLSQNIDAAVLELTRKGIWFSGLPTTNLSSGIITNVTNDHIGSYGVSQLEDLLDIKGVVATNARNIAALNHQDELLRKLGKELKGPRVVYFSLEATDEMSLKNDCIYLDKKGLIVINSNGQKTVFMDVGEIPFCGYGKISHNIGNVLAALSALYFDPNVSLDLDLSSSYLKQLKTNDLIPGRFNQYEFVNRKIIFDYAHNPDGIRKVGESLMRIESGYHSCLISIAENRDLDFCRQMAQQLSKYFNPIYLKETDDECKSDGGINILDLRSSIKSISPQTSVIFLSQSPYQNYMDTLKVGETGIILGAGLGNVTETQKIILQYIREAKT